jgi:hypothetical protein
VLNTLFVKRNVIDPRQVAEGGTSLKLTAGAKVKEGGEIVDITTELQIVTHGGEVRQVHFGARDKERNVAKNDICAAHH